MSLCGLCGRLFMQRINLKKLPDPSIKLTLASWLETFSVPVHPG
jgi:hypothetical protein